MTSANVFLETLPGDSPPRSRIACLAPSRVKLSSVPLTTTRGADAPVTVSVSADTPMGSGGAAARGRGPRGWRRLVVEVPWHGRSLRSRYALLRTLLSMPRAEVLARRRYLRSVVHWLGYRELADGEAGGDGEGEGGGACSSCALRAQACARMSSGKAPAASSWAVNASWMAEEHPWPRPKRGESVRWRCHAKA